MNENKEDLQGEEWRDVPNYEGLYQVSNMGRVKSLWHGKETILKGAKRGNYLRVRLCKNEKKEWQNIHKLVMLAVVGECPKGKMICHENDIGTDNRAVNLRYDTQSENYIDRYRISPNYKYGGKGLSSYEACYVRMLWNTGNVSIEDMATMFKANKQNIYRCITYKTFTWLSIDNQISPSITAIRYIPMIKVDA